jgi:hemerythrin superfamily protein
MDVYQILIQDHRKIANMFETIIRTSHREAECRGRLFSRLWELLEDHELTEENDLLPVILEASSFCHDVAKGAAIKELIAEIFDDHADFEVISQQISKLPASGDEWLEQLNELRNLVGEHVRNEEQKLFPVAQEVLDQTRAEEIGRQIEARRSQKI